MIVILFTQSYPYDVTAEHTFISPEIHYLAEKIQKIIVVPRTCKGKRLPLPPNVEVDDRYADFLRRNSGPLKIIEIAFSLHCFFQEIRKHPSILLYPSKILKLILFSGRAELTRRWVTNLIKTQYIDMNHCILYSYWFDHVAAGLAMIKQEFPATKIVSRAHGYDIYEEHYYPYYWPYRRETADVLDTLFFASEAGKKYFSERYPEYLSKLETAHMGVKDSEFITKPSGDGIFRIVSCSYIVVVKRLNLLMDGIATAARLRPEQKFEWIHFGDGKGRKSLNKKITQNFPSNAQSRFFGHVPNDEIMQYYKDNPVDVFVNVSKTEGVPVSIQEAISCGIPIIATSVGGNPEIVSEKNGILLAPNPKPEEIAAALLKIWDNPMLAAKMRTESRQIWQSSYNAEVNFRAFAERLKSIRES